MRDCAAKRADTETRTERESRVKAVFAKAIANAIVPNAARTGRIALRRRQFRRPGPLIFTRRRRGDDQSAGQQESREPVDSAGPSAAFTKVHCGLTSKMKLSAPREYAQVPKSLR